MKKKYNYFTWKHIFSIKREFKKSKGIVEIKFQNSL